MSAGVTVAAASRRPWGRAALWLAALAPFFYATYGFSNWLASLRTNVPSVVFAWEPAIPFLAWTIIPYWSINALYGLSLFVCSTREELDTHGRRLLTAQIVAVTCFILFPLRFTFTKPEHTGGFSGFLFDALAGFDKPFNQAPSLHIALLVILWAFYTRHWIRHFPSWGRVAAHAWFALIGVSVLTTYQHHFVDIPTGALLGFFVLWLWPDNGPSPLRGARLASDPRRRRLFTIYAIGGALIAGVGILIGGVGLWLLYPAVASWFVALNYLALGAAGFEKGADGKMSFSARVLFAPSIAAAWINSRLWTRRDPAPAAIADGVFLGRIPSRLDRTGGTFATVVDLAAELPAAPIAAATKAFPALDLVAPPPATLRAAADAIAEARSRGNVLVCCALGYSRSAAAVATWLARSGREKTVEAALARIRAARPRIVIGAAARAAIETAAMAP